MGVYSERFDALKGTSWTNIASLWLRSRAKDQAVTSMYIETENWAAGFLLTGVCLEG